MKAKREEEAEESLEAEVAVWRYLFEAGAQGKLDCRGGKTRRVEGGHRDWTLG